MKKRWLSIGVAFAMTVGMLAGCSSNSSTSVDSNSETKSTDVAENSEGAAVSVEFLSQKRETVDLFDSILGDFMKENPEISMVQTTTTGSVSLLSRVASNDLPQLNHVYGDASCKAMAQEGLFMDLRGQDFLDKIPEEYLKTFTLEDGTIWAVPINVNAFGLYINEDIYAQYDLKIPETFDELIANCEVLQAAGVAPFAFPYKEAGNLRQIFERTITGAADHDFVAACDGVGYDGKSFADYPDFVKGMEALVELLKYANEDPLGTDTNDVADAFANQKVAMVLNGTWGASQYLDLNPELNFKVVLVPSITGVESKTVGSNDLNFAVSALATKEEQEACLKFIEYFLQADVIEHYASEEKSPCVVKGVQYESKELADIFEAIRNGKFLESPSLLTPNGYYSALQGELQSLIINKDVPAFIETLDNMTREIYAQQEE